MINAMIHKKLIACANTHSITSYYKWKGKSVTEPEIVARLKTSLHLQEACINYIKQEHDYDLPCIWWEEVRCSTEYGRWVNTQTQ